MFDMIGHTFAQKTLVKIPNRGQNPRSQKGWFSFLARSPNFTIEVQIRPTRKLLVISGNTFFIIGGHSNFECKLAKNRVEHAVNSNLGPRILPTSATFPDKPLIKTYVALWESCRSIAPLQLLFSEIFKFVDTFWSFVISKTKSWNWFESPTSLCRTPERRARTPDSVGHVSSSRCSGVRVPWRCRCGPAQHRGYSALTQGRTSCPGDRAAWPQARAATRRRERRRSEPLEHARGQLAVRP
jgi:hypothetical protein